jgi:hypothetical protein
MAPAGGSSRWGSRAMCSNEAGLFIHRVLLVALAVHLDLRKKMEVGGFSWRITSKNMDFIHESHTCTHTNIYIYL